MCDRNQGDCRTRWIHTCLNHKPTERRRTTYEDDMAGSNWGESEIRELLSNRAEDGTNRHISRTVKDGPALEKLTKLHNEKGFNRTKAQVISKLKALRNKYHQVNDHNRRSGRRRLDWPYLDLCQTIWGSSHLANPVALVSSMEEQTEDADTFCSFPEAFLLPVHRCSSPASGDGSGSDDSSARSSTACAPAHKRRRRVTRAQVVTEEIKRMLLEMDRKDEEKDRLREERQRAEEEQHRREAREAEREAREVSRQERTEQALYFGSLIRDIQKDMRDQTSLLRDLVSRMPGPTGQHASPHNYFVSSPN